jgi:hypothetical protein
MRIIRNRKNGTPPFGMDRRGAGMHWVWWMRTGSACLLCRTDWQRRATFP